MDRPRLTTLLVRSVVGTYLLVALGATAAADAGPIVTAGHHLAAVLVGLLLVVTAVVARRSGASPWVARGTLAVLLVYPVQAGIGLAGASGFAPFDGRLHLLGGVAVFGTLLVTLLVQLEATTLAGIDAESSSPVADPSLSDVASPSTGADPSSADADPSSADADPSPADVATTADALGDRLRAYLELTKPRLMWLLCLLALAGMGLATATGAALDGVTVVATLAGGVLAIGAAGTFNHVYERDRDRKMRRTADRPVATDRVGVRRAIAFGIGLVTVAMAIMVAFVNVLAAALTAAAVVYYAYVYTVLLKPTTRWNTVIGGGSGALPALIGYAAVTGTVELPAILLAVVVFCWTPAHFYNLAIAHRDDYARADYPMMPVLEGVTATRRRIVGWLGVTLLAAVLLGGVTDLGVPYALATTVLGGVFVRSVVRQYATAGAHDDSEAVRQAAYRSFHASNAYLGGVLAVILLETLVL
ncbi:protoheme IX farnesyltransferase [Halopenitus malekzadehii]|uniref:Protoheme IX farnesyltransferase n=1 Tax=Halopenitus malekzadehii TaxID=1267564 RepID=A0A1H6JWR1_9EURY|nr:heme o synthase [Halopenitus malekzadehii]SEH63719.1 protoheme IX farnesyltransferase [Halopenitus malekzadehii]